jgi:hypothetical protein
MKAEKYWRENQCKKKYQEIGSDKCSRRLCDIWREGVRKIA